MVIIFLQNDYTSDDIRRGYFTTIFTVVEKDYRKICKYKADNNAIIHLRYKFPSTATYTFTTNENGELVKSGKKREGEAKRTLGYSGKDSQ